MFTHHFAGIGMRIRWITLVVCTALLAACAGQEVQPTRIVSAPTVAAGTPAPVATRTPNTPLAICKDTARAQAAVLRFITLYNAADLEAVMKTFSPSLRVYLDAAYRFQGSGQTIPDVRSHLTQRFAEQDQLLAPRIDVVADASAKLVEFNATLSDVQRTNVNLKSSGKLSKGQIQIGLECDTLLLTVVAIQTR
jgi:hypothetical protein